MYFPYDFVLSNSLLVFNYNLEVRFVGKIHDGEYCPFKNVIFQPLILISYCSVIVHDIFWLSKYLMFFTEG